MLWIEFYKYFEVDFFEKYIQNKNYIKNLLEENNVKELNNLAITIALYLLEIRPVLDKKN